MPPEINLTEGAIAMLASGEGQLQQGGNEVKPVLQVADVRLVNAQTQNNTANERYRLLLSDGVHLQQGMLGTQRNELVRSQKLQKGSIIQLTQFVCNLIQSRMIIIIIDLDVILERCAPIGVPKQFPVKNDNVASSIANSSGPVPPMNQTADLSGGAQQFGAVSVPKSNLAGGYRLQPPVVDHRNTGSLPSYSSFPGSHDSTHNAAPVYQRTEYSTGISCPPVNYLQPPQPSYQQTPQPSYQQTPPIFMNKGPIGKNEAPPRITPIAALNPYQGRWTIKARVTVKGDLRRYSNNKGDGKVFSFDLLDADGGQIRATCFNMVADQFYDQIEPGKVFMISKGTLKPAQKAYNHLPNDHEITLDSNSIVQPCFEDDKSIPHQQFKFCPISDIESMDKDSFVDVMGVITSISSCGTIMRKNGTETQKRTLHIKDMSGRSIEITLWGNFAIGEGQTLQNMCDSGALPVVAVKCGRVNDFNGKSITTLVTSRLFIEPDFPEAHNLKAWFDREGKNIPFLSLSREAIRTDGRKTIVQIKDENLGTSAKPDWITICATLKFLKVDSFCYTACTMKMGDRQCGKKVTNIGDGKWRCEKCDQTMDECDYRYMLQLQIQDHTGVAWATSFQEAGEEIMGLPAKELYFIKYEEENEDKFTEIVQGVLLNKYIFKLKVEMNNYNDEQRIKSIVVKAERLNFPMETRYLLDLVHKMKIDNSGPTFSKTEHVTSSMGLYGSGSSNEPAITVQNYSVNPDSRMYGNQGAATAAYGSSQYGGSRVISTNPSGMYINCKNCGGTGHNSMNCPCVNNTQGHQQQQQPYGGGFPNRPAFGASTECFKCHQFGHWAKDCPGLASFAPPAHGSANTTSYSMYGGVPNQRAGGF